MKKIFLFFSLFCTTINLFSQGHQQHFISDSAFLNNTTPCGITSEILKTLDVHNEAYNPKTLPTAFPGYAIISCGKFDIYYEDLILTNPQVGFSDPVNGAARRNTLCAVLTYVQSVFDFSNIPSASPIRLHVNESFAPIVNPAPQGMNALAFAGPTFINNATPGIIKGFVHDYTTTGTPDDSLFIAYRDSLANTNIGLLYEFTEKLAAGDTLGAYSSLMAVNPSRCPETSQKIVYEIYWKTWAKDIFAFEPQDSLLLYQIAEQRPHICGTAVYDARVMLGLDFNDFEDAQPRMANVEDNEITINDEEGNYKGVLYPNPANDYVIYKTWLNEGETLSIVFYDVMGKPIISKQITGTTEEQFDLSKFSSGIYFYKITFNQKQVQTGKLIISK